MEVQTFSIIAGTMACNARCPFCVSKMTPPQGMTLKEPDVNWRNFHKSAQLAKEYGAKTVLITGKGEPTLFPGQITSYLHELEKYNFPIIELQTNGISLYENKDSNRKLLQTWYDQGLTTIAISIVHYDKEKNKEIYLPYKKDYIELPGLIDHLHDMKYSVRLSCVMADNYISDKKSLEHLIHFASDNSVEQLTLRPVNKPDNSLDDEVSAWIAKNYLKSTQYDEIQSYLNTNGKQLMKLSHGATVYDVYGQNVCLTNSLTIDKDSDSIRQLIFFPDGHLTYDWQYKGAILL